MRTRQIAKALIIGISGSLVLLGAAAQAQSAAATPAVPSLPAEVTQVLQLEQAKVGDSTVVAYVKNSGNNYNLNAEQILYLRQQGVSDAVLTAMLSHPKTSENSTATAPAAPANGPAASATPVAGVSTVAVLPPVTYVQPVPTASYYYPAYRCVVPHPVVRVGWGWHRGWGVGVVW